MSILCKLFGHKWEQTENGIQSRCTACGKIELAKQLIGDINIKNAEIPGVQTSNCITRENSKTDMPVAAQKYRRYFVFTTSPAMKAYCNELPPNMVVMTPPIVTARNDLMPQTEKALGNVYLAAKERFDSLGIKPREEFLVAETDVVEHSLSWLAEQEGIPRDELQQYYGTNIFLVAHDVKIKDQNLFLQHGATPPGTRTVEPCAIMMAFFE